MERLHVAQELLMDLTAVDRHPLAKQRHRLSQDQPEGEASETSFAASESLQQEIKKTACFAAAQANLAPFGLEKAIRSTLSGYGRYPSMQSTWTW
jgi:hypothetical protein